MRTMRNQATSILPMVLLALIRQAPRSGYDLRRLFALSPMGHFSDSPGSIYPALARLQERGWIGPLNESAGSRRRQRFAITRRGLTALKKWLVRPVTRSDVKQRPADLMLRFVFLFEVCGTGEAVRFLTAFERELSANTALIREFLKQNRDLMSVAGRMALEYGLSEYTARTRWVRRARAELQRRRQ